jgi:CHAT domain-containing protein
MRLSDLSVGLIEYAVGTEHIFCLVIDGQGRVQRFELAATGAVSERIEMLMDALLRPLGWVPSRRAAEVRQFADEWGKSLLPPADALRRFDVLLIVPHHFLHGVPLHLVKIDTDSLAITHGVAYCSSATLLERCSARNAARRFDPGAWTFPFEGDGTPAAGPPLKTCRSCTADILTNKSDAYDELGRAFSSYFPTSTFVHGRDELKQALLPQNRTEGASHAIVAPDVLCVVCHGHVDARHIERSGLLLRRSDAGVVNLTNVHVHDTTIRIRDHPFAEIPVRLEPNVPAGVEPEMMTSAELQVMCECDAQLVALFGCSTGTGQVASNDDYVSLACQWLKVGAVSVVANLWEADVDALAAWARQFAKHWVKLRQPKAIAMRDATRAYLAEQPAWAGELETWGCVALLGDWL